MKDRIIGWTPVSVILQGAVGEIAQLILIKHAMPVIDPARSAPEWVLSEEGRAQSLRLAERLTPYNPEVIVSSDEPKAQETARIVAERLNLALQIAPGLHEHDRQGVPYVDKAQFHATVLNFFANPSKLVFGRETADEACERFHKALQASVGQYQAENVVVVSHGTVISLFVAKMTGTEPFPVWERLGLPAFVVMTWPAAELIEIVDQVALP